jgi:RNA polymerase sigma factor FliA
MLHRYREAIERRAHRLIEFAPAYVEVEDLIQAGSLGLLRAFRRTQASGESHDVGHYLSTCIWGSLVDEVRRAGGVGRDGVGHLQRASWASEGGFDGGPVPEPASGAWHTRADRRSTSERSLSEVDRIVDEFRDDHDLAVTVEAHELWRLTEHAIARLPHAERLVLLLYYFRGATMLEIARMLRFTQSRASHLHHSALARLRLRMRRFAP